MGLQSQGSQGEIRPYLLISTGVHYVFQVLRVFFAAKNNHVCRVSGYPMIFFWGARRGLSILSSLTNVKDSQDFCWEMYEYLEIVEWYVYPIEI